jgi:Ras-related protein Rab-1A
MDKPKGGFNEYDYLFKFILVGAAGVGKTSIILRYCENSFKLSYSATLGIDFRIKTIKVGDKVVKLQIWDTAGQERYNAISPVYFRGCHGCIVVYDLTDPESLVHAKSDLLKASSDFSIPEGCSLLVGNKSDLKFERKVPRDSALDIAKAFQAGYIETSAKTADQVDEIFYSLAESLIDQVEKGNINIDAVPKQKKAIIDASNIEIKKSSKHSNDVYIKTTENQKCC